jgi:predicted enzyme related to lactoylglutathione lyase
VTHFSRLFKIVIDVPAGDHEREVSFWEGALGLELPPFDMAEYHGAALHGQDFWLLTQRLDEGTARVHLDIHTDDLDAEVARLEQLGAEPVRRVHGWQVMRDPAGLLFCVLPDPPGTLNEGNAHRWP